MLTYQTTHGHTTSIALTDDNVLIFSLSLCLFPANNCITKMSGQSYKCSSRVIDDYCGNTQGTFLRHSQGTFCLAGIRTDEDDEDDRDDLGNVLAFALLRVFSLGHHSSVDSFASTILRSRVPVPSTLSKPLKSNFVL